MGHSRGGLHPVAAFVGVAILGSTIGVGLHVWFDPWASAVAVGIGAVAGLLVSHAIGADLASGLLLGGFLALAALGVRAFVAVTSPRVGFAR